jgi:sulfatase maturation enzyme AslB (radical SAM superfamily)
MDCKRCYGHLDAFPKPYLMDFEMLKKCTELFLSQVPPHGGDIIFFGGEPLVNWPLIEKYLPWFRDLGAPDNIQHLLTTNGLALSRERIDFLVEHRVKPISLSLDGDYSVYRETRDIPKEQYDHIVSMIQYGLSIDPNLVVPFCVLKRKHIPAAYDILSHIVSLGARIIDLYRDLYEEWTEEERTEFVKQVNAVIVEHGVIIQPYCESIFDCRTCYAPSIMVYPNGDIYDSCYTMASVLRGKGVITEEDCQVLYMGNVATVDGLYLDVEKKRQLIRPHMECYLVDEDVHVTWQRLYEGTDIEEPSFFRVTQMV